MDYSTLSLKLFSERRGEVPAVVAIVFALALLFSSSAAHAADLSFPVDTTLTLTDPAISVTVLNGSTANSLTVGVGTIAVTVPGGSGFSFTSASRGFTASGQTAVVSITCSAAQVAVVDVPATNSQAQTVTFTPTAAACTPTGGVSTGGSIVSGGGGGGGGGGYTPLRRVPMRLCRIKSPHYLPNFGRFRRAC